MISGVYKIINTSNNKFYIGSSKDCCKRWKKHTTDLCGGVHHNVHLQRAWNYFGEKCFVFEIVEEVNVSMLLEREQYWLDHTRAFIFQIGYNIGRQASGGDNLTSNPKKKEIIKKISETLKNRFANMSSEDKHLRSEKVRGENNPNFGNHWSIRARHVRHLEWR
jgi:group I intron endonuclease